MTTTAASGYSYPNQIWHRSNKTQNMSIEDNLCAPTQEEYEPFSTATTVSGGKQPMDLHSRYSKFKISILNFAEKNSLNINIDPKEMADIIQRTAIANEKYLCSSSNTVSTSTPQSPAYTVVIAGGRPSIKGKTPAQAIAENVQSIQDLDAQRTWLTQNLPKYPKNQVQIDAINDAFTLYNEGKLSKEAASAGSVSTGFKIYHTEKFPDMTKPGAQTGGKYVSSTISFEPSMNYPICIKIVNSTKMKDQTGKFVTQSEKAYDYRLSMADWNDALRVMKASLDDFERSIRTSMRNYAKQAAATNRSAAAANKQV